MQPIFFIFGATLIGVLAWWVWAKEKAAFEEKFPPISDAEFVARCAPGTDPKVALKVRRIVAENLGVEYERIHPSTRFVEDLEAG